MELPSGSRTVASGWTCRGPRCPRPSPVLLDLARDAAHEVERIAAPLTTFLVGVAVGRGLALEDAAAPLTDLLAEPGPQADDSPG